LIITFPTEPPVYSPFFSRLSFAGQTIVISVVVFGSEADFTTYNYG